MKLCPTCGDTHPESLTACPKDGTDLVLVRDNAAAREAAMIGKTIDRRYVIQERLGAGGMGTVYIAQQTAVGRRVAIKVLPAAIADDLGAVKRFMQEARAASTLSHPNGITVHDFGQTEEGLLYLVMEYVEGVTLARLLKDRGALPPERAVRVAAQILSAVEDAHDRGIVHRDLKPDNVIIATRPGNPDFAKVLDFGLAKVAEDASGENLTKTGQVFGTPAYMSPEQARGVRCDLRTDLYAIGVMLYEMLAGARPFDGESPVSILVKHINEAPAPFSRRPAAAGVGPALESVVMRALAKRREDRFPSAREMRAALEDANTSGRISVPPGSSPSAPLVAGTEETLAPEAVSAASIRSLRSLSPGGASPGAASSANLPPARGPEGAWPAPTPGGSGPGRTGLIGAGVLLLGGGLAAVLWSNRDEPPPIVAAAVSPVPPASLPPTAAPSAPRSVTLTLEATPATARASVVVIADGRAEPPRTLAPLPAAIEVPVGARLRVTVTAAGHEPLERELVVEGPLALSLGLIPLATPTPAVPATSVAAATTVPRAATPPSPPAPATA
ncbi:protein kinase, partial [Myxococcota bacterium]|nr:protein kinase [Myxococcota bacterium]